MTRLHALLVGIGRYLPPPDGGESPFPDLGGSVHDVERMADFLERRVEAERRVETLTSPLGETPPTETPPRAALPTLDNLRTSLHALVDRCAGGDEALIFFAGHGARLRTAYPDLKGSAAAYDEALVPCDATGRDAPVLRDVELAHMLLRLVDGGVFVTVILDCCHAGGALRRARGVAVRCADVLNGAVRPRADGFASDAELERSWRSWHRGVSRNLRPDGSSGWLPSPRGYVLLAACGAHQRAHEHPAAAGRRGGVLTDALLAALDRPSWEELSWSRVHARVLAAVHGVFEDQTPVLEGAAERRPFGGAVRPLPPAVPVLRAEEDGRVLLAAGRVQGVGEGSRLAVYPPGASDLADPAARLATVRVVDAGPSRAWAEVVGGTRGEATAAAAVPPASRAVLVDPGERALVTTVAPRTAGADGRGRALLAAVGEAVRTRAAGGGFLSWLDEDRGDGDDTRSDARVDVQVTVDGDRLAVLDPGGSEIALRPHLPARTGSVAVLARRLDHLARFRAIERLANPHPVSGLAGRVDLALFRRRHGGPVADDEELTPLDGAGGVPRVEDGWKIAAVVRNHAPRDLHAALFVLRSDRGITQLWPSPEMAGCDLLPAGGRHAVGLTAALPPGYGSGRAVLKVFAAVTETDYRWLSLPVLDRPLPGPDRGYRAGSPLERLLAALGSDRGHGADLALGAEHGWTTAQVETRTVGG